MEQLRRYAIACMQATQTARRLAGAVAVSASKLAYQATAMWRSFEGIPAATAELDALLARGQQQGVLAPGEHQQQAGTGADTWRLSGLRWTAATWLPCTLLCVQRPAHAPAPAGLLRTRRLLRLLRALRLQRAPRLLGAPRLPRPPHLARALRRLQRCRPRAACSCGAPSTRQQLAA